MNTVISKPGTLYIVATPIGNLDDITQRARLILDQVDLIAAEDTRHSAKLLSALGVSTPLMSLHEHNEIKQALVIKEKIEAGRQIALISDAGTPLISDPGFNLIDLFHQYDLPVVPIPGPSSVITAICASGISASSFDFIGFLPAKASQRRQLLMSLKDETHTQVFFESPHRIAAAMDDLVAVFGESRQACICRELTKQFETIIRGSLLTLRQAIQTNPNHRRGEIVMVISGADNTVQSRKSVDYQELLQGMLEFMPTKEVAKLLARHSGLSRNVFYEMALKYKSEK